MAKVSPAISGNLDPNQDHALDEQHAQSKEEVMYLGMRAEYGVKLQALLDGRIQDEDEVENTARNIFTGTLQSKDVENPLPDYSAKAMCRAQEVSMPALRIDKSEDAEFSSDEALEESENFIPLNYEGEGASDIIIGARITRVIEEDSEPGTSSEEELAPEIARLWISIIQDSEYADIQGDLHCSEVELSGDVSFEDDRLVRLRSLVAINRMSGLMNSSSSQQIISGLQTDGQGKTGMFLAAMQMVSAQSPSASSAPATSAQKNTVLTQVAAALVGEHLADGNRDRGGLEQMVKSFAGVNGSGPKTAQESKKVVSAAIREAGERRAERGGRLSQRARGQRVAFDSPGFIRRQLAEFANSEEEFVGHQKSSAPMSLDDRWGDSIDSLSWLRTRSRGLVLVMVHDLPPAAREMLGEDLADALSSEKFARNLGALAIEHRLLNNGVNPSGKNGEVVMFNASKIGDSLPEGFKAKGAEHETTPYDLILEKPDGEQKKAQEKWYKGDNNKVTLTSAEGVSTPQEAADHLRWYLEENDVIRFANNDDTITSLRGEEAVPEGSISRIRVDIMHPMVRQELYQKLGTPAGVQELKQFGRVSVSVGAADGLSQDYSLAVEWKDGKFSIKGSEVKSSCLALFSIDTPSGESLANAGLITMED